MAPAQTALAQDLAEAQRASIWPKDAPVSVDIDSDMNDADLRKELASDAQWAAGLIDRLLTTGGDQALKPGLVVSCEGLAFVRVTKGGLGVTLAKGRGFAIRKLDQDSVGRSRWSAPLYFTVSQLGVGLVAGYETVESCLALMSMAGLERFATKQTLMGSDIGTMTTAGRAGVAGGALGRTSHMDISSTSKEKGRDTFAFSIAEGMLANVSINGTETHPGKRNRRLYGEDVDVVKDILGGKTRTFEEFMPLYNKLQEVSSRTLGRGSMPLNQ